MSRSASSALSIALAIVGLIAALKVPSSAENGQWTFDVIANRYGIVSYTEGGNEIFVLGCTRHSGIQVRARSPDQSRKDEQVTLTLDDSEEKIDFRGVLEFDEDTNKVYFTSEPLGDDEDLVESILVMISSGRRIEIRLDRSRYSIAGARLPDLVDKYVCD